MKKCSKCKLNSVVSKRSSYCGICNSLFTRKRSTTLKKKCVEYKGGKCCKCGYNKCLSALEFHHINPNDKLFTFSGKKGVSKKTDEELHLELDKCDLLCANCHREVENAIIEDKYRDYLHFFE